MGDDIRTGMNILQTDGLYFASKLIIAMFSTSGSTGEIANEKICQ